MKPSILLVEDEAILADTLLFSMQKLGYECRWAKTLKEARALISKARPELMVLDRQLPDGDGLELLQKKDRGTAMVLILSSKSSVQERVKGLSAGADDYLPKPFSFPELAARLEALERRRPVKTAQTEKTPSESLWELNSEQMNLLTPQGWVSLTPLEFKFMKYLKEREGTIVSKERLLKEVWGFSFLPKTRTVDYLINQLRKRIEPEPDQPQHLLTIRGAGVKFVTKNT